MSQPAASYSCHGHPVTATGYNQGKLPPVKAQTNQQTMCVGRMWVFLVLGVLLFVLGLISVAVYLNIDGITSSTEYTEIIPLYVSAAAIFLASVGVGLLFWKRYKCLVFFSIAVSIAAGLVCGVTAVLSWTQLIKPLQTFVSCRYYMSQKLCQCFLPFQQDTKYDFQDVESCDVAQNLLPKLLYILIGLHTAVFFLCVVSAVISLLILRIERLKQRFLSNSSFDDVYAVNTESMDDTSDSETEVNELVAAAVEDVGGVKVAARNNSQSNNSMNSSPAITKNSTTRITKNSMKEQSISTPLRKDSDTRTDISTSFKSGPHGTRSVIPDVNLFQDSSNGSSQMLKSPELNGFGKKCLVNQYRRTKTPDRDIRSNMRLSKSPDRNIISNVISSDMIRVNKNGYSQRCPLSASRRLSKSCDSLDSYGSSRHDGQEVNIGKTEDKGVKNSKLKEHRKHGKRAATVHNLDTEQLLLILNLQMRYLQETEGKQRNMTNNGMKNGTNICSGINSNFSRRAITPQPLPQKQTIPQKVRSHTPTLQQMYGQFQNQKEYDFYPETYQLNKNFRESENASIVRHASASEHSSRCSSTSSGQHAEYSKNNMKIYRNPGNQVYFEQKADGLESKALLERVLKKQTKPFIKGYNPYISSIEQHQSSADDIHVITYADSMINNMSLAPKSHASVQNYGLSPLPLCRNTQSEVPAQLISRKNITGQNLPAQSVHHESSAFYSVNQNSQLPSPSTNKSQCNDAVTSMKRTKRKDYAEVVICENLRRNSKPFIFRDEQDLTRPVNCLSQETSGNFTPNPVKDWKLAPTEILPPYSCPPSYKEYVSSSCSTSIHSSISSNPDDLCSVSIRCCDFDSDEDKYRTSNVIQDNFENETNTNIYSNADLILSARLNDCESIGNNVKGQGYRSKGHRNGRSVPSKSKVKQFIVPEDYYSCINKSHKLPDGSYANDTLNNPHISSKYMPGHASLDQDKEHVKLDKNIRLPQNIPNVKSGYSMTNCEPGQKHLPYQTQSFSRHQPMYPVSNVIVKFQDIISSDNNEEMRAISLVSNSVQNVHAENTSRVPRIRLNDQEMISLDKTVDDVFEDTLNSGNQISGSFQVQQYSEDYITSERNGSDASHVTIDAANQTEVLSHVTMGTDNTCRVPFEIKLEVESFEETGV